MASLWNAMMMLLVIFVESTVSQLVERDDGYVLIERHKDAANGMFSSSVLTTGVENADDPEANTYCIIGSVDTDDFRFDDGRYELQLIYKYSDGTTDTLDWSQTSWVNADAATGVDLSRIVDSYAGDTYKGFHGLAKSSSSATYVDGSPGIDWWHAVASISKHGDGIPGHQKKNAISSELWVQKVQTTTPEPTEFHCVTHGCDDKLVCDAATGICERNCDILHIDDFLLECSEEWDSNTAASTAMATSIATNTANIATVNASAAANAVSAATNSASISAHDVAITSVTTTANANAAEITTHSNSIASNAANIATLQTEGSSVESRLSAIESTLNQLSYLSAHSSMGAVDASTAIDLVDDGSWSTMTLSGKDVVIVGLLAVNVVLITSMTMVCCKKQREMEKY